LVYTQPPAAWPLQTTFNAAAAIKFPPRQDFFRTDPCSLKCGDSTRPTQALFAISISRVSKVPRIVVRSFRLGVSSDSQPER
jgi:hypothetical protein